MLSLITGGNHVVKLDKLAQEQKRYGSDRVQIGHQHTLVTNESPKPKNWLLCSGEGVTTVDEVTRFRTFTTSARQLRNKVPEAQKLFQEDNGLPVHIKGGTSDVMLYRATMILSGIGTCYSLYWLLLAAAPQKNA
ncbi:Cytochrome c oxidase subunit 7A2, mitochondrial [Takifugu flavidus]|uniref:Cytochrome c oxidase subunit 7A1, mitochondrial n=1 Tax=Takifugu flavidus TaxID=433684 RepID=A0A5C6PF79_9TELE|nr:Cytochrome c oxidase subunit 7A2, mitochondrial [Takifugu flavidus]